MKSQGLSPSTTYSLLLDILQYASVWAMKCLNSYAKYRMQFIQDSTGVGDSVSKHRADVEEKRSLVRVS